MNLTIKSGTKSQEIFVESFTELAALITVYLGIPEDQQCVYHGNRTISSWTDFETVNPGDILIVRDEYDEITYDHPYLKVHHNGSQFKAIVDTGAQCNLISSKLADFLGISSLIDTQFARPCAGVGVSNTLGDIRNLVVDISGIECTLTFSVMESQEHSPWVCLLGTTFLRKHKCVIDYRDDTIEFNSKKVRFLNLRECQELEEPVDIQKKIIKHHFTGLMDNAIGDSKIKVVRILKTAISNIVMNPEEEKFRTVNLEKQTAASPESLTDFLTHVGFSRLSPGKCRFTGEFRTLEIAQEIISF